MQWNTLSQSLNKSPVCDHDIHAYTKSDKRSHRGSAVVLTSSIFSHPVGLNFITLNWSNRCVVNCPVRTLRIGNLQCRYNLANTEDKTKVATNGDTQGLSLTEGIYKLAWRYLVWYRLFVFNLPLLHSHILLCTSTLFISFGTIRSSFDLYLKLIESKMQDTTESQDWKHSHGDGSTPLL